MIIKKIVLKKNIIKQEIINMCLSMNNKGINQGSSGNISHRTKMGMLITPRAIPYESIRIEDIVEIDLKGNCINDQIKPSSEWKLHSAIYKNRSEIKSIIHCH